MTFDKKFWQRAFLAFTTGLFLSCAAHMSSNATTSPDAPAAFQR